MRVSMVEGHSAADLAGAGDVVSIDGDRAIVRSKVTAVRPRSAAQLREVNGVTRAARFFANGMSSEERSAALARAGNGPNARDILVAVMSSIYEGDVPVLDPDILIAGCGQPVIGSPVWCPAANSISMALSLTSPRGDERGWLGASRPLRPGRRPRSRDVRRIASGFSFPVILDVGEAYLRRFGRMQSDGFGMVQVRAVSASAMNVSSVVSSVIPIGCGSSGTCSFDTPVVIPSQFGSTAATGAATFEAGGMLEAVGIAIADVSVAFDAFSVLGNGGSVVGNLRDVSGVVRSASTTVTFTLLSTGDTCSVPLAYSVQGMMI